MPDVPEPIPHPGVLKISPYVSGKAIIPGIETVAKLSANENPLGPSPHAVAAYRAAADSLHRYPDSHAVALRRAIGHCHGLDPTRIICGCGSDELLSLLGHAYAGPGDEIIYSQHGFLLYPIIAHAVGATPVIASESDFRTNVDSVLARVTPRTRVVYLANPNNPTGTYLPAQEMARLHRNLPASVLLVIDAAYAEYVCHNDYAAGIELVEAGTNAVMTRTFSKIYGLPSLRLGWAYGPPSVIDTLNRIRGPFNVSTPAQAAGIAAVEDTAYTAFMRAHNDTWRPWLTKQLRALGLVVLTDSVANFVLIRFPTESSRDSLAADAFLCRHGFIARRMDSYGLSQCLRISVGRETDMQAVVKALTAFLNRKDAA
ncbi:Biosynthetic Aromatic amino acid aminotransferase beta [invertebrate metagenome]|uniref:Biosynthetic Aromatic amino acid aminotransferase beta n=1 Tax=invertebrate metagenome TaxID=1711999 RepID=A0A484HCD5_9ZZZZ